MKELQCVGIPDATRPSAGRALEIFEREQIQPRHLPLPSPFYVEPSVSETFCAPEVSVDDTLAP
jgi:hypothetical protein